MITIIAGSRDITDMDVLLEAIKSSKFEISEVVCGGARGVDRLGKKWAESEENKVPVEMFIPRWSEHGKSAGFRRNYAMAGHAEALIAIWDGESRGTKHMIDIATKKGLQIYVHTHLK